MLQIQTIASSILMKYLGCLATNCHLHFDGKATQLPAIGADRSRDEVRLGESSEA